MYCAMCLYYLDMCQVTSFEFLQITALQTSPALHFTHQGRLCCRHENQEPLAGWAHTRTKEKRRHSLLYSEQTMPHNTSISEEWRGGVGVFTSVHENTRRRGFCNTVRVCRVHFRPHVDLADPAGRCEMWRELRLAWRDVTAECLKRVFAAVQAGKTGKAMWAILVRYTQKSEYHVMV